MGRSESYKISPANAASHPFNMTEKSGQDGSYGAVAADHFSKKSGIHWIIVVFLIVGEMAGGGLVALPGSMVDAGIWAGVALVVISAIASGYTAVQLGDNWLMMQERWPKYRRFCGRPYPEMAYRALGSWGRIFLSVLLSVQQFCLSVVFLLLASNNISALLFHLFSIKLVFCYVALIVAAALLPLLMLGSPKDFWQVSLIAVISTSVAVVLIFIGAAHDQEECLKEADYPPVAPEKFFLAYGAIMFAYGGHACFPTFQQDMSRPEDFRKSVIVGWIITILMYLPVSIYGYIVYGGSLTGGSIIPSIQLNWAQTAVNVLVTVHVFFSLIILVSPLMLTMEQQFAIPNVFGFRRAVLRTSIMIAILFVALTIPKFGPILDLVGGSTMTLTSMIMPGICYIALVAMKNKRDSKVLNGITTSTEKEDKPLSIFEVIKLNKPWLLLLNFVIIAFGLIAGVASTFSAVNELISASWDPPCYISLFAGTLDYKEEGGLVHCCGAFKNVTTVDVQSMQDFCAAPKL